LQQRGGENIIAIYARQSVDREDSISTDSQIEACRYEARGERTRLYVDKGYSGKDTDRPCLAGTIRADEFEVLIYQEMVKKLHEFPV
jgi:DNA invertase Pin-like site-specific DNA recombinase